MSGRTAPAVCAHGAPQTSTTVLFTWYGDNCAISAAAAHRGEDPKPMDVIIEERSA